MNAKHTPGPWKQGENPMDIIASSDGQWDIATVAENCGANDDENTPPDCDGESLANAHLIAAAPDLLAACKFFIETNRIHGYEFDSNEPAVFAAITAAIAKAEGNP